MPDEEAQAVCCAGEAAKGEEGKPGGLVGIDERAGGIKTGQRAAAEHGVHGLRLLTRCEAKEQCLRLGAADAFPGGPLHEGGGEDLGPGAFGQDGKLEVAERG